MGEAKQKKDAGYIPASSVSSWKPDLGAYLLERGCRGVVTFTGCRASVVSDAEAGTHDVTFNVTIGEDYYTDTYCGTINTSQPMAEILLIMGRAKRGLNGGSLIMVECESIDINKSDSVGGERYNLIRGNIRHNLPTPQF